MNEKQVREVIARTTMADEAFADGANDYGHDLLKDLIADLEQWLIHRKEAAGRQAG